MGQFDRVDHASEAVTGRVQSDLRCEQFIDSLKGLLASHMTSEDEVTDGDVLRLVSSSGITRADFMELDERPGQFDHRYAGSGWYRSLRVVRNDGGNDLFVRLEANEAKAARL